MGISGATENHAKKHTKNASQLMWNARIAGVENEKSWILVAFFALGSMARPPRPLHASSLTTIWPLGPTRAG